MSYMPLLAETEVPEDYGQDDITDDFKALIQAAQTAYSAFKVGDDFHGDILQALERAHRIAMSSGGPHSHDESEEEPAKPESGSYGIFTKDQLGGDTIPGRAVPTMSWLRTHESLEHAIADVQAIEDLTEIVYVAKLTEELNELEESTGRYWANIVYYRTPENLPEELPE